MNEIANNSLEKRNKEHYEDLKVAKLWMTSTMDKKELKSLWLERDKQGTRKIKIGQHSGWKKMQDLIRWKELEQRAQHSG